MDRKRDRHPKDVQAVAVAEARVRGDAPGTPALLPRLCSSELHPLHVAGSGAQAWLRARGQELGAPAEPISSCCLVLPPRSRAATALLQVTRTGLHGDGTFPTLRSPAELPPLHVLCSPNNGLSGLHVLS